MGILETALLHNELEFLWAAAKARNDAMKVLARYSYLKLMLPYGTLIIFMFLLFYYIPFCLECGDFRTITSMRGPLVFLPVGWIAGILMIFPLFSVIYCIFFQRNAAVRVSNGKLIYINSIYLSIPLVNIKDVSISTTKSVTSKLSNIVVTMNDGKKKYIPLSVLDRSGEDIIRSINSSRGEV